MNRVALEWNNGSYIVLPINSSQSDLDGLIEQYGAPDSIELYIGETSVYYNPIADPYYSVETDGVKSQVNAASLAELANKIRGTGKHIRVWSQSGLFLLDTKLGDPYNLIQ